MQTTAFHRYLYIFTLLMCLLAFQSVANTINVNANCSLVEAIQAANTDQAIGGCIAGSGSDLLQFDEPDVVLNVSEGLFPSIIQGSVLNAFPPITSEITLEGNGLHIIADSSLKKFRVFEFFHTFNQRFTMKDVTISGADQGSGIGSALFSMGGNLTLMNCQFKNNHGAVLLLETLDAIIDQSLFFENWAEQDDAFSPALETIGSSFILKNSSLIQNQIVISDANIDLSDFHPGGGLSITSPLTGFIRIENNTFSGNQALTGGGITIKDQRSFTHSEGTQAPVEILFNTLTDNHAIHAGGIAVHDVNSFIRFEHNLIIANTAIQSEGSEVWLAAAEDVQWDGHNVIATHDLSPILSGVLGPTDLLTNQASNQIMGDLQVINSSYYHPLLPGSVAIDYGKEACDVPTDMLQTQRPVDGNNDGLSSCDPGSIEFPDIIFLSTFE